VGGVTEKSYIIVTFFIKQMEVGLMNPEQASYESCTAANESRYVKQASYEPFAAVNGFGHVNKCLMMSLYVGA